MSDKAIPLVDDNPGDAELMPMVIFPGLKFAPAGHAANAR